jgi:hypothetical protein
MRDAADIAQVRQWWRRWPEANVGVITGAVSGLVVLDVDPRNCGEKSLAELEGIHGPLHRTIESLTGGGGQHLYFRHPATVVPCGSVAPGLDVKADGGLVVCPPSGHVSGRDYVWEPGCSPDEALLADLPPWLEGMIRDSAPLPASAGRSEREVLVRTDGERAEFAALWATIGLELRPGDRNYLCPFHPDHHPSLHIDAEGCRFYCFGCGRGGGSGRLRRLVDGSRRPVPSRDEAPADLPLPRTASSLTLPDGTEVRVVGESAYQDALLELTGGRRLYGGVRMERVAHLAFEPDNAEDPGAISVTIAGRRVGYLTRPDATRYRDLVATAIDQSGEANCMAVIVGGWEREHGDVGLFGMRLNLADPDAIS